MNFETRFFKKVLKTNSCWLWIGATAGGKYGDYGVIRFKNRQTYAHRASYEYFKELIPPKMQIDHLCRNRSCVNPDHLECVSQQENLLRGDGYTAMNARKTHCKRGHEFTLENTCRKTKWRRCKICMRNYNRHSIKITKQDN